MAYKTRFNMDDRILYLRWMVGITENCSWLNIHLSTMRNVDLRHNDRYWIEETAENSFAACTIAD